jgi:hypothetical protein
MYAQNKTIEPSTLVEYKETSYFLSSLLPEEGSLENF